MLGPLLLLSHLYGRCCQAINGEDAAGFGVDLSEGQDAGWTALYAGAAADALDVFHGLAFVGEAHDIDSLMAHRCADVARDALLLVGQDAKA